MKKRLLFLCGWVLIGLGAIGVVLPILPTTPFVLLAAICFSSSSEQAYRFLLKSRVFGPYIENYKTKRGISPAEKARAIIVLWVMLAVSATLMRRLWLILLLAAVGIGVTVHLLMLKTRRPEQTEPGAPDRVTRTSGSTE